MLKNETPNEKSNFLKMGSILKLNREVFLLNYKNELEAFESLNANIEKIQILIRLHVPPKRGHHQKDENLLISNLLFAAGELRSN